MDPGVEKAFEFAQDVTKQIISLSTAIVALTITFLTDVVRRPARGGRSARHGSSSSCPS
jgi:hypothetical protein